MPATGSTATRSPKSPAQPTIRSLAIIPALLTALSGAAWGQLERAGDRTSITIYSTAQPGAVPASAYRPVPGTNPYQQQTPWGYNQWGQPIGVPGYAVVRHDRTIAFGRGRSELRFTDVAAFLDPTTVSFTSLTDPAGTKVLEQSYRFDLVSQPKLLERFIGKEIEVDLASADGLRTERGTLLSAGQGTGWLVLSDASGKLSTIAGYTAVRFPSLPEGLLTRPTLVWDMYSNSAIEQRTRVSYQTEGITWWADYNMVFAEGADANSGTLDVGAWVSILNQSGATYPDATLKLVAGDVHRAPPPGQVQPGRAMLGGFAANEAAVAGFEEKGFFEYHLYTLGRPATIDDNSTKQIELFDTARGVPAEKVLVYYGLSDMRYGFFAAPAQDRGLGTQANTKVDVYLKFKNSKEHGMGIPMPSGRIRVSKLDTADGSLEFIGEDTIDHTPRDEDVLIKMGNAFDVVGDRVQTDFRANYDRDTMEEDIAITVRNHKDEPVEVLVRENLFRWVNWEIKKPSHAFEKADSRTIHFPITVPANGEVKVTYTVRYWW